MKLVSSSDGEKVRWWVGFKRSVERIRARAYVYMYMCVWDREREKREFWCVLYFSSVLWVASLSSSVNNGNCDHVNFVEVRIYLPTLFAVSGFYLLFFLHDWPVWCLQYKHPWNISYLSLPAALCVKRSIKLCHLLPILSAWLFLRFYFLNFIFICGYYTL